jgi:hypothetical protein
MFRFFDGILAINIYGFFLNMFKSTFNHLVHLLAGGPLSMLSKHL